MACTGDACGGGDDGAQWRRDGLVRRLMAWLEQAQGDRDTRRQTLLASALMARRRGGRRPAVIASIADHGRGERAGPACQREGDREGEGGRADEWGQPISRRGGAARARAGVQEMGRVGRVGNGRAGERERERGGWAGSGGGFPFSFSFSISISISFSLFL